MAKIKVRKDVAEEVTNKLQGNKNIFTRGDFDEYKISDEELKKLYIGLPEDIQKSNPYPRQEGGRWGFKPDLVVRNHLTKAADKANVDLDNLPICKQKEFDKQVDYLYNNNYSKINEITRLPNLNQRLAKQMGLGSIKCFYTKKQMIHSRPTRKAAYNQDLRMDEFKRIPIIIHNSNLLYWDKRNKNFFIPFMDRQDSSKVNKIVFYKDVSGNYAVTVGKVDITSMVNKDLIKVGVGVAPTIHKSNISTYPITRLSVSPTDSNIAHCNNLSSKNVKKSLVPDYNGENRKGQTFDINITDITENNKQQKLEQFSKALNAIADNKPFMIKHIPADGSANYGNLMVRITNFDRNKIEKAVHNVALSLDADISGASKGETFVYESQKELTEKFFKEFTNRTRAVYNFVISYFDLPDIRIVSKAGELRHKGKILYNPSTGLPIKESDWKKFVTELEKYLNRNYTGIGEKIVLSAESLGIILDRLSKTNSMEAIRKMSLAQLKAKRYDVDWISESVKNMKDKFGDAISRERQARIQIAQDSAAQRVTRVKDDIRNNIQQIIIDGIRDKQSKSVVAQNLFDKCASLNRDMQRIADSEVQMAATNAYIKEEVYNTPKDEKIYFKRFEMIDDNTCKKCKKINGTVVLWSDVPLPDEHIKDPYAKIAIWEGKTDGEYPESIVHSWCRGTWVRYYPDV